MKLARSGCPLTGASARLTTTGSFMAVYFSRLPSIARSSTIQLYLLAHEQPDHTVSCISQRDSHTAAARSQSAASRARLPPQRGGFTYPRRFGHEIPSDYFRLGPSPTRNNGRSARMPNHIWRFEPRSTEPPLRDTHGPDEKTPEYLLSRTNVCTSGRRDRPNIIVEHRSAEHDRALLATQET